MLEPDKIYRNNDGRAVAIGGRVRDYSADQPYVWSIRGDWYHERTGEFISWSPTRGHYPLGADCRHSISDHTPEAS